MMYLSIQNSQVALQTVQEFNVALMFKVLYCQCFADI